MIYRSTDQYKKFHCIADRCPENCCEGWQIMIDGESLARYRKDGIEGVDWKEECFLQHDRRCHMLQPDGLCRLQCERGEEYLCDTCRRYPRHMEEYEGEREYSLSLSCPEVARMLLHRIEPIRFVEWEDETEDDYEEFDYLLYTKLCDARKVMFDWAQNREYSLSTRLLQILQMAQELQNCLERDEIFEMDDIIESYTKVRATGDLAVLTMKHFDVLFTLERLNPDWNEYLNDGWDWMEEEHFPKRFEELLDEYAIPAEQLLMFFLYSYFNGAVYDDLIFPKAALAVFSVCWILVMHAGRTAPDCEETFGGLVKVSYRYAREIEHSEENLNVLDEYFYNGEE